MAIVSLISLRSQGVVVADNCSSRWLLAYGVPQGLVISFMLFNICLKVTGRQAARKFGLTIHSFISHYPQIPRGSRNPEPISGRDNGLDEG